MIKRNLIIIFILTIICTNAIFAQDQGINWAADGTGYYEFKNGGIVKVDAKTEVQTILVKKESLIPLGGLLPLVVQSFNYSNDKAKILLFANTAKVWRYNTRGDYWVMNTSTNKLTQLGKGLALQSLMFAKFSPDSKNVAYVSESNIYRRYCNRANKKAYSGWFKKIN